MKWNSLIVATALVAALFASTLAQQQQPPPPAAPGDLTVAGVDLNNITVSSSWPDDPKNVQGWAGYAAYLGAVAGIIIFFGSVFTIAMWSFCCCYKCGKCRPALSEPWRKRWIWLYIIFYIAFAVLGAIAIATVASTSTDINNSVNDVKNVADKVGTWPSEIAGEINDSKSALFDIINNVTSQLSLVAFDQINNQLDQLELTVNNTYNTLQDINATLIVIGNLYNALLPDMNYLLQLQNQSYISGVPDNSTYHQPPAENDLQVQDAKSAFDNFETQINDARTRIDDAQNEFRTERDNQTQQLETDVDDIINSVLTTINNYGDSITSKFSSKAIANSSDYYVALQNQVREGVIIGLVGLNLLTYALWFLGFWKKSKVFLKMPFYFASFTVWWLMLITALHFFIWVPVKDVCNNGVNYIKSPGAQSSIRQLMGIDNNGTSNTPVDPSAPVDPSSPQAPDSNLNASSSASGIFNQIIEAVITDPQVILNCSGNQTFFQRINVTVLDQVPQIKDTIDNFQNEFLNATSQLDANATADEAIAAFQNLSLRISDTLVNLDQYDNDTSKNRAQLANITQQVATLVADAFSIDLAALALLNAKTNEAVGLNYSLANYSSIDLNSPPYTTVNASMKASINDSLQNLTATDSAYNQTVDIATNVTSVVADMNVTIGLIIGNTTHIRDLVQGIQDQVNNAVLGCQQMAGLQSQFIQFVINLLDTAVNDVLNVLKLQNVAQCGWIGDFWRDGVQGDVCDKTNGSVGTAAFMLVFACLLMFLSTPIIWYSKKAILDDAPKNIQDEDL